jgi:hypothetical protein
MLPKRLLIALLLLLTSYVSGQTELVTRAPAATRFVSAHGRRAWAGGYSHGGLEIWAGDVTAIPGNMTLS